MTKHLKYLEKCLISAGESLPEKKQDKNRKVKIPTVKPKPKKKGADR